jgi:hypothetical protein
LPKIVLELPCVSRFVEAVERSPPQGKTTPVLHPRREALVRDKGSELAVQTIERGPIALIVRALDLCDE